MKHQQDEASRQAMMAKAIALAYTNTAKHQGKPFGAVIVKDGQVIATGVNEVVATCDPTTHAEMQAIREASRKEKTSDLSGYELYASGQPCPMCLSAMYLANIQHVYYGYSEADAAEVGLSTSYIYEQMALPIDQRDVRLQRIDPSCSELKPLEEWNRHTQQS